MGVHGLWDLIAPVGRRVSVETLAGRRLAIDASIWMVQFMKAMRDEKGEMVRNAHVLGFFRRICKLLFLRTKPVFVFDGATPALKRRTVIARRRQRENAQAKVRKMAEKLLLNHVKAMRLKMLAEDIKDQTAKNKSEAKEAVAGQFKASGKNDMESEGPSQNMIDEMLAASILAEECDSLYGNDSPSSVATASDIGNAPASATASQVGMRLKSSADDSKHQSAKNNAKGKEVMVAQSDMLEKDGFASESQRLEMIDEMLAASVLAEDCVGFNGSGSPSAAVVGTHGRDVPASTSATAFSELYEDEESDEEMILPVSDANVDPAVLAALPPSMQLDLLVQMRERLMAENRQKYQKVKKAPQKFSELQIEAYLKTVAFRREIDVVQRAASGRGMAGVQTSRIASEANREFIFSSSFSGDKQLLTASEAGKSYEKLQNVEKKDYSRDVLKSNSPASNINQGSDSNANNIETVGDFVNDVQTFLDERGCMRVSRRRAMGIRMTRDLERNIDMLKEVEQERTAADNIETAPHSVNAGGSISGEPRRDSLSFKDLDVIDGDIVLNNTESSLLVAETGREELSQKSKDCIKISFDYGDSRSLDGDDELFAQLVVGEPVRITSAGRSTSDCGRKGNPSKDCGTLSQEDQVGNDNDSELEWEEGFIGKEVSLTNQNNLETNNFYAEGTDNYSDVEWEEGSSLITNDSKLETEALGLQDHQGEAGIKWLRGVSDSDKDASESFAKVPKTVSKGSAEEAAAVQEAIRRSLEDLTDGKDSKMFHLEKSGYKPKIHNDELSELFGADNNRSYFEVDRDTNASISSSVHSLSDAIHSVVAVSKPAVTPGTKENTQNDNLSNGDYSVPTHLAGDVSDTEKVTFDDGQTSTKKGDFICNSTEVSDIAMGQAVSVTKEQTSHTDERAFFEENIAPIGVHHSRIGVEVSTCKHEDNSNEFEDASVEDELLVLSREYKNLGDEQKKLERNADSVNTEMFVECQELLQMFGLPYIIAPMEAEAQCAYMELANLVDGVVTDDSDVFLFGARSVYKNIFDDRKYVETYLMKDIESELGLDREKLIRMAMLLGSDYTEGVSGIGIVNAIEVVNAFPEEDGLHKFREWIESPDPTILGKVGVKCGSNSKKRSKSSKGCKSDPKINLERTSTPDCDVLDENEDITTRDDTTNMKRVFMDKHRNVSKNWHIPASFPSDAVIYAYTTPHVDKSTEPFSWGKPDIFALRRLCWEKFGWASQKADELLQPVLKEYNKHETQLRLEAFYTFNERFAKIRSKRIKQAVKGITGKQSLESAEIDDQKKSTKVTEKGKTRSSRKKHATNNPVTENENPMDPLSSEEGSKGLSSKTNKRRLTGANSGKVREKQRKKAIRKGRKKDTDSPDDETTSHSSGSSCDEYNNELLAEKVELLDSVRRSKRARKAANYVEKDEETDEPMDPPNANDQNCSNEAAEHMPSHNHSTFRDHVAGISRDGESAFKDPSLNDCLAGDYLVTGGAFCAGEEELEVENVGLLQSEDTHANLHDKEYLQLGGGFCVDEDEKQDLPELEGSIAAEVTINDPASFNEAGQSRHETDQNETIISQVLNKSPECAFKLSAGGTIDGNQSIMVENFKDDASTNPFGAIPYLKKKRRKT